jgi:radical SAM superfamily enzyme YgiQ (UPF0313 family)
VTVLLVNPPGIRGPGGLSFFEDQKRNLAPSQYYSMPMEHLGLMSIDAYAAKQGVEITCINGMVASHSSVEQTWLSMVSAAKKHGAPRLVGFSCIDTFPEVAWLAQRAREAWQDVRIAMGNTMATLNYERILHEHDFIDFVVIGDGELAFTELAYAVLNDLPLDTVPGLAKRDDAGRVVSSPPNLVVLDELPRSARHELPSVIAHGFAGAVFTTRGCPYRCTFCGTGEMSNLLGRDSYRAKSITAVVDEIAYLIADFGVEFISITDDLFVTKHPGSQQRAADFADEILKRGLRIHYMVDVRVDSVVDLKLFKHLHRSGLRRVFIGLETGSYEQLRAYGKQTLKRGQDAAETISSLQQIGIEVIPGTIMFHPTVGPDELRETARLLRATEYKTPRKFMDRITTYAGTPLHRQYSAAGLLSSDWPIGRWDFVDAEAARVYADIVNRIGPDPDITYDEAEEFLLARLDAWDDLIARCNRPEASALSSHGHAARGLG